MNLTENTQATLLLTAYFSKPAKDAVKPLTPAEWGRFAGWLHAQGYVPADLLNTNISECLTGWQDSKISIVRLVELLGRGHGLAIAMEKWSRVGIWVLSRADTDYPKRLKQRLKTDAPPILFGCGNRSLLNSGGIAIIGSRNATDASLLYSDTLGAKVSVAAATVISGGARGIDEAAMLGALKVEGNVVGILADSLLRAATEKKWRKGLMEGNLVLASPFYPEAGFNAGNAMARNKYVYCLSDTAVVVHSGTKGGTLAGALENIKKQWVPLWVVPTTDLDAGNIGIVAQGANWCAKSIDDLNIASLFMKERVRVNSDVPKTVDIFSIVAENEIHESATNSSPIPDNKDLQGIDSKLVNNINLVGASPITFYQLFLQQLIQLKAPFSPEEVADRLRLHKSQVVTWLNQAQKEELINKLNKPVRYEWSREVNSDA